MDGNSSGKAIQWFPGHMAKTRRIMRENMRLVDIVAEMRDARIPYSSGNPEIRKLIGEKPRIIILNKSDVADPAQTKIWRAYYEKQNIPVLVADCRSGRGINMLDPLVKNTLDPLLKRRSKKGIVGAKIRMMVVGIPNSGKSSFINRLARSRRAKVEDRPGVTRGKQWVAIDGGMELLDMPGVLWPKFDDRLVAENLAFTGAIKDDIMDLEDLASKLLERLQKDYPDLLSERYDIETGEKTGLELLELIAQKRGMLVPGGEINALRAAVTVLDEFRAGKIGRITLEKAVK